MTPNDTSFCIYVASAIVVGLLIVICLIIELHANTK